MFSVEWDQEDINQLNISLGGLIPEELVKGELMPFTREFMEYVSTYPPPKADSSYIRTNNLWESWHYAQVNPLTTQVTNYAVYAGYVQGREQVAMHKETGWRRLYEEAPKWARMLIDKLAHKAGIVWSS
jgi:hypothetical protein